MGQTGHWATIFARGQLVRSPVTFRNRVDSKARFSVRRSLRGQQPERRGVANIQSAIPEWILLLARGLYRLHKPRPCEALADVASDKFGQAHARRRIAMAGDHRRCGLPPGQYSSGGYGRKPGKYTGTYGQLRLDWAATSHSSVAIEAVRFDVSDVIRRAGGRDRDYIGVQLASGW